MSYYVNNAIYSELKRKNIKNVFWVAENAWILVYGNANLIPKVVVIAHTKNWSVDYEIINVTKKIANDASLRMLQICFDSTSPEIEFVDLINEDGSLQEITLGELRSTFKDLGLPVSNTETQKAINSAESSAYHHWQRISLGRGLCVADIDLLKRRKDGRYSIVELKRSFYALDKWSPFPADFNNFYLLEKLCKMSGNSFFILYNRRMTKPKFFDDPSIVTLFDFNDGEPIKLGKFKFEILFKND
ncbi:hypothetical protein [Vibrio parahaemolyticus]|uniref:hypothetical protein n=1 Tax=Vibrio parahaemolyticus TaxID=670 RepID=UPI00329A0AB2